MDNRDILLQVCVRADIDSLYKLSSSPEMWERMRYLLSTSYFWYLRVQHLAGDKNLIPRDVESNVWKTAYYDLERCLSKTQPLQSVVLLDSSPLAVLVLLELGFDPLENSRGVLISSVIRERTDILAALLTHPKIDEETFRIIDSFLVYKRDRLLFSVVNTLLGDRRYIVSLPEDRKQQLYALITQKRTAITDAVRVGHTEIVRVCLELKTREPHGFNLTEAVSLGHVEIVRLLLEDGRVNPGTANYILLPCLGTKCLEILRLFQVDGRLNINFLEYIIGVALIKGNVAIVRELLPNSCPSSLVGSLASQSTISQVQMPVLELLLSDKRLNVSHITYTPSLIIALEPPISRRLINAYLAYPKPLALRTKSIYALFLRTLVIKRLSPNEALDWLIEQRDRDVSFAARSLKAEEVRGKFQEAFRGYFLCISLEMSVDKMSQTLKEEGRSREGIKLAERLAAVHLDREPASAEMYRDAFKAIFAF